MNLSGACQAPLCMEFSRQEYWSRLPCPSSKDHPNPGIKVPSPALAAVFFTTSATWEALSPLKPWSDTTVTTANTNNELSSP